MVLLIVHRNAMNGTPRLRSAFPSTGQKSSTQHESPSISSASSGSMGLGVEPSAPAIPFNVADAPSQRLYVSIVYASLMLWRLYDYFGLYSGNTDGFWLFTKWVGIDTVFLYGLSGLQIPWLQWSSSTFTVLFIIHGLLDWLLMFRIPIPLLSWLGAFTKILYDRELAVSERKVKPASILQNSSLILGKQIIHILPEGSAILNPEQASFCIGSSKYSATLPIQVNQTMPVQIDLLRVDLGNNERETIVISAKDVRKMKKQADRKYSLNDRTSPRTLLYTVKRTGLYRLLRVLDESKLEVRRRPSDAIVVLCPTASVKPVSQHRCKGELSDFEIHVDATPPLKIRYSKVVNRDDQGHSVLSIHPENMTSPIASQRGPRSLVTLDHGLDVSWARPQSINIPLNESLGVSGGWQYMIDEVMDAFNNVANYSDRRNHNPALQRTTKAQLEQHFLVHERPKIAFQGCDAQHPIKVEKGKLKNLPFRISSSGLGQLGNGPYTILYQFTTQEDLLPDDKRGESSQLKEVLVKDVQRGLDVREPGLYTLLSISSEYCEGEVLEPSSCSLANPPEPDLSISYEPIPDKCAGNSIGLAVDLHLLGTPPFRVYYAIKQRDGDVRPQIVDVDLLHTQLELRPSNAGHYTYEFSRLSDAVYHTPRSLAHKSLVLEQDVKPPASAHIFDAELRRKACVDEPTTLIVQLTGEPPFKLDYELVHQGKRMKHMIEDIRGSPYYLTTGPLGDGGEYILALTALTDSTGCKVPLAEEVAIDVSMQRPRASFGSIDGKRTTLALEGKTVGLPLRLQGEAPWTLYYRHTEDPYGAISSKIVHHNNDHVNVDKEGTYEIIDVNDATCPGTVDSSASHFAVNWIPRPVISILQGPLVHQVRDRYIKNDLCQDDEDVTDISFAGMVPFNFEYEQRLKADYGSQSVSYKKASSGLHQDSIKMETSEAGEYEYKFTKLGDMSYNHDHRTFQPVIIHQRVHPRPSALFVEVGKTYKYCQDEKTGGQVIPIMLVGQPPFHLELEIKHHGASKPEIMTFPHVDTKSYNLRISQRHLALGTHSVTIRKIIDSHGCQRQMDGNAPHILVSVADLPSISPLEDRRDCCAGDRISYTLAGAPPFNIFYTFEGRERKATVPTTDFRRLAEKPGEFVITAVSDQRSTDTCKTRTELAKTIHEMPNVRISKGRTSTVDIHEGGEAEILFEFGGTPPFHFT